MEEQAAAIAIGEQVRIKELAGEWVVKGFNKDGTVSVYGGPVYRKAFRDFPLERILRKVKK